MRILTIGGTRFVGRHFVAAAVARGHQVTVLHRGPHARGRRTSSTCTPTGTPTWESCPGVSGTSRWMSAPTRRSR